MTEGKYSAIFIACGAVEMMVRFLQKWYTRWVPVWGSRSWAWFLYMLNLRYLCDIHVEVLGNECRYMCVRGSFRHRAVNQQAARQSLKSWLEQITQGGIHRVRSSEAWDLSMEKRMTSRQRYKNWAYKTVTLMTLSFGLISIQLVW